MNLTVNLTKSEPFLGKGSKNHDLKSLFVKLKRAKPHLNETWDDIYKRKIWWTHSLTVNPELHSSTHSNTELMDYSIMSKRFEKSLKQLITEGTIHSVAMVTEHCKSRKPHCHALIEIDVFPDEKKKYEKKVLKHLNTLFNINPYKSRYTTVLKPRIDNPKQTPLDRKWLYEYLPKEPQNKLKPQFFYSKI